MKSPELENNEVTGDPKHKSLLFDLWQKVKFSGETKEKAAVIEPEIPPQTEASQTVEVPFEKSAASPALVQLYIRWMQKNGGVPQRAFSVEDFCAEPYPETELLKLFFEKI